MNVIRLKRNIAMLSLAGLLTVTLTGCAGDDAETDLSPSPTPTVVAAGGGSVDSTTPADTKADDAPTADIEPEPAPLEGAQCIYGTWTSDNSTSLAGMRQYGDEIKSVEGTVTVEYGEDGSLTTDYQNWLITAVTEGETVTILRHGTDQGTFSATDDTITMTDTQMGSTLTVDSAGMSIPVAPDPASYTDATYECSATSLVITTPDGPASLTR